MTLNTQPNLAAPDDVYEALIHAHDGLDEPTSHRMNAMLVLLLVNHIGDAQIIEQALEKARAICLQATG